MEENNSIGMVVGLVDKKSKEVLSFGYSDRKHKVKTSAKTIYEIGSVSKLLTSAILVKMADDQLLHLEDAIDDFLPKNIVPPVYKNIICTTIEVQVPPQNAWVPAITSCRPDPFTPEEHIAFCDLASMSSGLMDPHLGKKRFNPFFESETIKNPKFLLTRQDIISRSDGYLLDCPPGTGITYSEFQYGVLGYILTEIAGKDYDNLLRSTVAEPLGMNSTSVFIDRDHKTLLAQGYSRKGSMVKSIVPDALSPAFGVKSNVEDLMTFLATNLYPTEKPLEVALNESHHSRVIHFNEDGSKVGVGLGWFRSNLSEDANSEMLWHIGRTEGYGAFVALNKSVGKGLVILTNSSTDLRDLGFRLMEFLTTGADPETADN